MKRCLVSFAVVGLAALTFASAASAFTVTTTGDATSGACSLRVAIAAVAANTTGPDCIRASGDNTITLPAGTYTLTSGAELHVTSGPTVTIVGADSSHPEQTMIDAAGTLAIPRRVIEVDAGRGVTLQNLEVAGGLSASGANGASAGQGGLPGADGGGILNKGSLTLNHVLVTDNFTGAGGSGANSAGSGASAGSGNSGGSGGGIYNSGSLNVTASTITGNGTGGGGDGGDGGAGNTCVFADGGTGGKAAYSGSGGGIYNLSGATITTSTISQNFTGVGGVGGQGGNGGGAGPCPDIGPGIFNGGNGGSGGTGGNGSWQFDTSQFKFQYVNRAGGGGIANGGTLNMTASTISGNNTGAGGMGGASGLPGTKSGGGFRDAEPGGDGGSAGIGGGLLSDGNASGTLTNVTIAGNFTGDGGKGGAGYSGATGLGGGRGGYGGYGGGIWATGANNTGPLQLTHATISKNGLGAAGAGGDNSPSPIPGIRGQGAAIATGGRLNPAAGAYGVGLKNTLIANNGLLGTDVNCIQYYNPSQYVDYHDFGSNISYPDNSCPGANGNPMLGNLLDNGGPTLTMLPGSGSSAIGAVPLGSCTVNVDQRGFQRPGPSKAACDIGAVETGLVHPTHLTVSKTGTGGGTVTSAPTGINCGATCSVFYEMGTPVTLTAGSAAGSTFMGWSGGGCSGTSTCQVTLNSATSVTASFAAVATTPPPSGGGGAATPPPGPPGRRAAALKKCKKKAPRARAGCVRKARKLPV